MKTWLTRISLGILATATLSLAACEKDEDQATLNMSAVPQLTASSNTATISPTTTSAPGVTYTWSAANFGYQAAVTYTLQFAAQGTNFATVQEYALGSGLSKSFTVGELNGVYNALNCNITTVTPTTLDVRVKATVGDKVDPVYSPVTTIRAAPYQAQTAPADSWGIIGDATVTGWSSDTDLTYDFCTRTYKITNFRLDNVGKFKFRANDAWTVNLGGTAATAPNTPSAPLAANGPDISVPAGTGNYDITLNVANNTFTWVKR